MLSRAFKARRMCFKGHRRAATSLYGNCDWRLPFKRCPMGLMVLPSVLFAHLSHFKQSCCLKFESNVAVQKVDGVPSRSHSCNNRLLSFICLCQIPPDCLEPYTWTICRSLVLRPNFPSKGQGELLEVGLEVVAALNLHHCLWPLFRDTQVCSKCTFRKKVSLTVI